MLYIKSSYFWILLFLFFILFFFISRRIEERFETKQFPKSSPSGSLNDPRWNSLYEPQNSIFASNTYQFWKKWPSSYNSDFVQDLPPPVQEYNIALPVTSQYGAHSYQKGMMDYTKLTKAIEDNEDILKKEGSFEKKKLNPSTLNPLQYDYEVQFELDMLNRKSWINRWKQYNPMEKMHYQYDEIKSPIEAVNQLNLEFQKRCYDKQQILLNKTQLTLFGILPFDIYKYRIQYVEYNSQNLPLYTIQIVLFRESDLYLPTFSFQGFVQNGKPYIFKPSYIGGNPQDEYLMAEAFQKERNYEIINKNYTNQDNGKVLELNPDNVVKQVKDYQKSFQLKNQYACFNTDPDIYLNPKKSADILVTSNHSDRNNQLPTRENCEAMYDWYGNLKPIGILDKPCEKDSDCPYYQSNQNYENQFGKCGQDGKCELPVNMKPLGFRYFSPSNFFRPLCYNCNSKEWNISTDLGQCCDEQNDKTKYPYLKGPDYAYPNDYQERYNHYVQKNCHRDSKNLLQCK